MLEELLRLKTLEHFEALADSSPNDPRIIEGHAFTVGQWLGPPGMPSLGDMPAIVRETQGALAQRITLACQALNDYVHPNYGSHLLALFPERSTAGNTLLAVADLAYDELLRLDVVRRHPPAPAGAPVSGLSIRTELEDVEYFADRTAPSVDRALGRPADSVDRRWVEILEHRRELHFLKVDSIAELVPEVFAALVPLLDAVGHRGDSLGARLATLQEHHPGLGLPATNDDWAMLALARDVSARLEGDMQRAESKSDPRLLVARLVNGISLVLNTTLVKERCFERALIHEMNDRNPMGTMVAMRSLIEHDAVKGDFSVRVLKAWRRIEDVDSEERVPAYLRDVETAAARIMAGTKGTQEADTEWKRGWRGSGQDVGVNLRTAVANAYHDGDVLRSLYDYGSDVLHGTRCRSLELVAPRLDPTTREVLGRGLLALESVSDAVSSVERSRPAMLLAFVLDLAGKRIDAGTEAASLGEIMRSAIAPTTRELFGNQD